MDALQDLARLGREEELCFRLHEGVARGPRK